MNTTRIVLSSFCGLLLAGAPAPAQGTHPITVTDTTISDAIAREMLADFAVPSHKIDIATDEGITTLTGSVDNLLAKERAARIAETVKGVRAVVNRIGIELPEDHADSSVREDVISALIEDPATEAYEIGVECLKGHVTLTGKVDSWVEKELCARIAKSVRGVKSVENTIAMRLVAERPDSEIETEIEQRLRWDLFVDDMLIAIDVNEGDVVLTGTVGSAAEKRRVLAKAWTNGVKSVRGGALEVKRWARDADLRQDKFVEKPAAQIRTAVLDAFACDPRVSDKALDVAVSGDTVTLRGVVDNLKARRAAEHDASNTVGVHTVRNLIKVRVGEKREDAAIEAAIMKAVKRHPFLEPAEITVDVNHGVARLFGTVDTFFEKGEADDVTSRVKGVLRVQNNMLVRNPVPMRYDPWVDPVNYAQYPWTRYTWSLATTKSDVAIQRDIRDELWWSPFIDAEDVTVTVTDGTATLTGVVETWAQWRAAHENAYDGGATLVQNRLKVKTHTNRGG